MYAIFSQPQIEASAILDREMRVPEREIFSRQIIFNFSVKKGYLQHLRSL